MDISKKSSAFVRCVFLTGLSLCSVLAVERNGTTKIYSIPQPMPVISRNVPAFASAGYPSYANDNNYNSFWQSDNSTLPAWLAYDVSGVPVEQRGQVIVSWWNDVWTFYKGNQVRAPMLYTIDAHAGAGGLNPPASDDGGWVTLVNVDTSEYKARMHLVNLTDGSTVYNWVRIYINTCNDESQTVRINMDIHDAHLGSEDSWFFGGNSITAEAMRPKIGGDLNFAEIVNEALPGYLPATLNAGISGWDSEDGAEHIPLWVQMFPCHYVTLNYGTNDSGHGTSDDEFYSNFETMVLAVLNSGKIPVIPTIPWLPIEGSANRIAQLNGILDSLKSEYPEIINGPDFWTFFYENQQYYDPDDNIHPNPEGMLLYRRMWAEKMLDVVYNHPFTSISNSNEKFHQDYSLSQNYPNPFNPTTTIKYKIPEGTSFMKFVQLKIFDILGREVTTLVNEQKPSGSYSVKWDGTNLAGQKVGSGIYFYQLRTNKGMILTNKMMMLK